MNPHRSRPFEPAWRAAPRAAFDLERTATGRGTVALRIGERVHQVYRNANFSIYSGQRCNARCPFCVEELRPLSRGLELVDQKRFEPDDERYFSRLEAALDAVAPLEPSVSITGGEPSIDPRLPAIVDLLARRGARKRTMTTNASGLLRPSGAGDVLDRVLAAGLEHLNISRAHPDFAVNQRIMGTERPISDGGLAEVVARCAAAGVRVRLSCVLLRDRIDDIEGCLAYLDQAAAWGVDNVIFRQLMRYDAATVQRNVVTRFSDGRRAPMGPILDVIRPGDATLPGHPRFTFVRQVLGYYYYVEVYRYAGPRGPIDVCFEGADLADIQADARARSTPVVHELIFHPDTTLCSTWQPWDGILL